MKQKLLLVALFVITTTSAFFIGTTQAKTEVRTEVKTIEVVPDTCIDTTSEEFFNNFIDMRKVVDFSASETGLKIYTNDGYEYYWER